MTRPVIAVAAALLLGGCGGSSPPVAGLPTGVLHVATDGQAVDIQVSIAETDEARGRGLMGVEELADGTGMVFLQDAPVQSGFWMKDTLIPLSIAFWDQSGEILAILDMEPCVEEPCEIYNPGVTWIGAVEVNKGFFAARGVRVGDSVRLER